MDLPDGFAHLTGKPARHVAMLWRRHEYLADRVYQAQRDGKIRSFDEAEMSAIRFALKAVLSSSADNIAKIIVNE